MNTKNSELNLPGLSYLTALNRPITLFLDRDGVINRRLPGAYVTSPSEFVLLRGVTEALKVFDQYFKRIIVVTNQQGIGKGLMTEEDLRIVHGFMYREIVAAGGRIDAVYHCPDLADSNSPCRKPATGMARQARKDYPEIEFPNSIMIGDSLSDMEFGTALGMYNVLVAGNEETEYLIKKGLPSDCRIDLMVENLFVFAEMLVKTP